VSVKVKARSTFSIAALVSLRRLDVALSRHADMGVAQYGLDGQIVDPHLYMLTNADQIEGADGLADRPCRMAMRISRLGISNCDEAL
jgi:hypothetical protein